MVKHAQTIRRLLPANCLNVFVHFVVLALERLSFMHFISNGLNDINLEILVEDSDTSIITVRMEYLFAF